MKTNFVLLLTSAAIALGMGGGLAIGHVHDRGVAWTTHASQTGVEREALAHARSEFSFTVNAPMAVAAALFGPEGERSWGGTDWNPIFLYPEPAKDVEGAVFLVEHAGHKSTWIATAMDFAAGHIQYVNFIDGALATRIDIRLAPKDSKSSTATVVYERTAMRPELSDHVKSMAHEDSASAASHWETQINSYLKTRSQKTN